MPIIEIKLWEGRTREQKAEMAKRITDAVSEVAKTAPENVHIIFSDYDRSDWSIAGRLSDTSETQPKTPSASLSSASP